jgi:two-component system LytT family response regulator
LLPVIVFVTAYDEHAVTAFEVSAVDYLLKPVLEDRFRLAVRRVVERALAPRASDAIARLSALAERLPTTATDRIPLALDGRVVFLSPREIDWVDADDDHIRVHAGAATHLVRETMASVESRLGAGFVRIHRSTLVNARRIREIQPWVKGDYVLIMHDGTRLTSGRTYREHVRALMP